MNFFASNLRAQSTNLEAVKSSSSASQSDLRELKRRIDRLEMVSEGIWCLLKEKTDLTDSDLIERIAEIDLVDGRYDGQKKTPSFRVCTKCGRKNNKSLTQCMYCGEILIAQPFD